MITVKTKIIQLGEISKKIVKTISSEPCEGDMEKRLRQQELFDMFCNNFDALTRCEHLPFQKMSMSHNGERWIVELEATEF